MTLVHAVVGKNIRSVVLIHKTILILNPRRKRRKIIRLNSLNQITLPHLLDFIIGLQLHPNNHGKNIRIEKLATHIVTNLNDKQNGDLTLFKKHLDDEYNYDPMEDLPENLFCENVVFYGGNYTVFSGIYGYRLKYLKI